MWHAVQIYVGNLVQGLVNEEALRQLFNTTMRAAFPEQQVASSRPAFPPWASQRPISIKCVQVFKACFRFTMADQATAWRSSTGRFTVYSSLAGRTSNGNLSEVDLSHLNSLILLEAADSLGISSVTSCS